MNVMKTASIKALGATFLVTALAGLAAAQTNTLQAGHAFGNTTAGGGGGLSSHYSNRGSLNGMETAASAVTTAEGVLITSKSGAFGLEYEVVGLKASANPQTLEEDQTGQLGAVVVMDDDSTLALDASGVRWTILDGPIASIDETGAFQTALVYQDTAASVRAAYQDLTDTLSLRVINIHPDDYGAYAKDGLPDDWQIRHFGEDNPDGMPGADSDSDNQDNNYEFQVGTDPRDPESLFQLVIQRVQAPPGLMNLVFHPVFPDRQYTVQYQLELGAGPFVDLESFEVTHQGFFRTVTDLNATDPKKTYRVKIELR